MEAVGFHGTSQAAAASILANGFNPSRNAYDWLGDGVYFFQDAPMRAREWARDRFGDDAAVLRATIDLDGCMDMLDVGWHDLLRGAFDELRTALAELGLALPIQSDGAHRRDNAAVNLVVQLLRERGTVIRSVRSSFAEGAALFVGSAFRTRSHVQISVRDLTVIRQLTQEAQ